MALNAVGLLGGSFDPVHLAHVALAKAALAELALDQVQLIPAGEPWQRGALVASAQHRLAMLELAIEGEPAMHANAVEIEREGKTYTLDTVRNLPAGPEYVWIIGADQLENFHTWQGWREIAGLVRLAVAQRPGANAAASSELHAHLAELGRPLLQIPFSPMPISASDIRQRLAQGASTEGMLDREVARYIERHELYRDTVS